MYLFVLSNNIFCYVKSNSKYRLTDSSKGLWIEMAEDFFHILFVLSFDSLISYDRSILYVKIYRVLVCEIRAVFVIPRVCAPKLFPLFLTSNVDARCAVNKYHMVRRVDRGKPPPSSAL